MESQWTLNSSSSARPGGATRTGIVQRAWEIWWCRFLTRRACRRTATALKDLDEHVLRDIGAPDWAVRDREVLCQIAHNRRAHWLWN